MKLSIVSILLSIFSLIVPPIIVIINYSLFGSEDLNLKLMYENFIVGLFVYIPVVCLSAGCSITVLIWRRDSRNSIIQSLISIVILLFSLIVYGPTIVSLVASEWNSRGLWDYFYGSTIVGLK